MCSRSGPGEAEVPRDRLEPVARQLARREVVAQHRVERVDQLAARRDEAARGAARRRRCATPRRAARCAQPGGPIRPSASGTPSSRARRSRNGRSKPCRLWFSMTSGSAAAHRRHEPRGSARPRRRRRRPRASSTSVAPAGSRTATMKIRSRAGVEPGGLEVELQAAQLVERRGRGSRCARSRRGTAPRAAARARVALPSSRRCADAAARAAATRRAAPPRVSARPSSARTR